MQLTADQILEQMDDMRDKLISKINEDMQSSVPADTISDLALKLAVMNTMLGREVTSAKAAQLRKERATSLDPRYSDLSATALERVVRSETIDERVRYQLLKTVYSDTWSLIDTVRTHLKNRAIEYNTN